MSLIQENVDYESYKTYKKFTWNNANEKKITKVAFFITSSWSFVWKISYLTYWKSCVAQVDSCQLHHVKRMQLQMCKYNVEKNTRNPRICFLKKSKSKCRFYLINKCKVRVNIISVFYFSVPSTIDLILLLAPCCAVLSCAHLQPLITGAPRWLKHGFPLLSVVYVQITPSRSPSTFQMYD